MTATFFFGQNVNLSFEFCMRCDGTGFSQNLTSFDFVSLNASQQNTDVVTSFSLIQQLTEHFNACYNYFSDFVCQTNDFNFILYFNYAGFYSTCSYCTTTCDGEYVFDGHQERFVCCTFGCRNVIFDSFEQFQNLVAPRTVGILQSLECGTSDDGNIITGEFIFVQQFSDFHFNQIQQFFVFNHVAFVHEYNNVRNAYLSGQQDVFSCLSHRTVCCSYYQDSTIHLSSTCDHVFNIVSMAGAVNVSVVSVGCFVFNVSCGNCDTTFSFFGSLVDVFESYSFTDLVSFVQCLCDCCSQSCFTMVNVTDSTNIHMRFGSFKFCLCHFKISSL